MSERCRAEMIHRHRRMKFRAAAGAGVRVTIERDEREVCVAAPTETAFTGAYLPTPARRKQMHSFKDSIKKRKEIKRSGDVARRDRLSAALLQRRP